MRIFNTAALSLLVTLAIGSSLKAELPPSAYADMQSKAPEMVAFRVMQLNATVDSYGNQSVTIYGKITEVRRSKAHLRVGQTIKVTYSIRGQVLAGPSSCPLLMPNQVYGSYLKWGGNSYVPAAMGRSFIKINQPVNVTTR